MFISRCTTNPRSYPLKAYFLPLNYTAGKIKGPNGMFMALRTAHPGILFEEGIIKGCVVAIKAENRARWPFTGA